MKLNIIGNMFGSDGYSVHTRSLANAIDKLDNVEVSVTSNAPQNWIRLVNDRELKMLKRNREDCDTILMIGQPVHWKTYLSEGKKFIGFLVFEGDKIPKSWIDIINDKRVNQIWVPSIHVKNAILNTDGIIDTSFKDKIHIVPHGVDLKLFYPNTKKHKEFTFLVDKGWRNNKDRGGTQYAIKAFMEEFNSKDKTRLLIKINPSYGIPDVHKLIMDMKIKNKDLPKIDIIKENLKFEDLNKVYNLGDVFVQATRAEAFGLGMIQAFATGLPVITTKFGGQTDFVEDKKNGFIIGGKMENVDHEVLYEGISWLTPDINELRKKMRWCYTNRDNLKNLKNNALETSKEFTWEISAIKAQDALKLLD